MIRTSSYPVNEDFSNNGSYMWNLRQFSLTRNYIFSFSGSKCWNDAYFLNESRYKCWNLSEVLLSRFIITRESDIFDLWFNLLKAPKFLKPNLVQGFTNPLNRLKSCYYLSCFSFFQISDQFSFLRKHLFSLRDLIY